MVVGRKHAGRDTLSSGTPCSGWEVGAYESETCPLLLVRERPGLQTLTCDFTKGAGLRRKFAYNETVSTKGVLPQDRLQCPCDRIDGV